MAKQSHEVKPNLSGYLNPIVEVKIRRHNVDKQEVGMDVVMRIAYDQCKEINPSHPEYVAEKIGEMYQWLKALVNRKNIDDDYPDTSKEIQTVLNAIEKRE